MVNKEFMNVKQASEYLGLANYRTIYSYIDEGLPVILIGNTKRIRKSDIDKFMADHTVIKTKEAK